MTKSAGEFPLLSPEEEILLGKLVFEGVEAKAKLLEDSSDPSSNSQLQRIVEEGHEARNKLIVYNERLVISIARKYFRRSEDVPLEDMIQEGNIGLIRAAEKFDYHKGFRFSTYASWWINQSIMRGIAERGKLIRLPANVLTVVHRAHKAKESLAVDLERPATGKELADSIDEDPARLQEYMDMWRQPLSLDWKVGEDTEESDTDLGSFLADTGMMNSSGNSIDETDSTFNKAYSESLQYLVESWVDTLSPRDSLVLRLRFGLEDGTNWTLEEIGNDLGITRERVRQIQDAALREIRLLLKEDGLSFKDFV